ncbi:MAG: hypothetical protein CW691_05330 [Candidatus Bathyarchaeum sp.]|nr:MAG: hypothetical protein CW691_05330 [Candidatus Bathyarchaeum sp.]
MREPCQNNKIFKVIWNLRKKGYAESTVNGYSKKLRLLNKFVSLDEPEIVNRFIANKQEWTNNFKEVVVNAYLHYVRYYGLKWDKPKYRRSERLPNVPTTEQVEKLDSASIASRFYKMGCTVIVIGDSGVWKNLSDLPFYVKVTKKTILGRIAK